MKIKPKTYPPIVFDEARMIAYVPRDCVPMEIFARALGFKIRRREPKTK